MTIIKLGIRVPGNKKKVQNHWYSECYLNLIWNKHETNLHNWGRNKKLFFFDDEFSIEWILIIIIPNAICFCIWQDQNIVRIWQPLTHSFVLELLSQNPLHHLFKVWRTFNYPNIRSQINWKISQRYYVKVRQLILWTSFRWQILRILFATNIIGNKS